MRPGLVDPCGDIIMISRASGAQFSWIDSSGGGYTFTGAGLA